mmetsp:Transcript_76762/g.148272  ORF Transcript_76762/g.148272 Transcript_76762/m.148272 type:complete len:214 (-) Transcript_76762:36-677(-)
MRWNRSSNSWCSPPACREPSAPTCPGWAELPVMPLLTSAACVSAEPPGPPAPALAMASSNSARLIMPSWFVSIWPNVSTGCVPGALRSRPSNSSMRASRSVTRFASSTSATLPRPRPSKAPVPAPPAEFEPVPNRPSLPGVFALPSGPSKPPISALPSAPSSLALPWSAASPPSSTSSPRAACPPCVEGNCVEGNCVEPCVEGNCPNASKRDS